MDPETTHVLTIELIRDGQKRVPTAEEVVRAIRRIGEELTFIGYNPNLDAPGSIDPAGT